MQNGEMLEVLARAERALAGIDVGLLDDPDGWNTLDVDYEPPRVERLWREFENGRLYHERCVAHRARPLEVLRLLVSTRPNRDRPRILMQSRHGRAVLLLLRYFRQERLDKFFRAHAEIESAEELDFFTAAEILETNASERRREIPPEYFYPLLDKNKSGFLATTTAGADAPERAPAAGSGNEAIVLKRLRARAFRLADVLTPEDRKFIVAVHQVIADGRVGKNTVRRVKDAFDKTDDPVAMIGILRRDIARQYLLGAAGPPVNDRPEAPRELILSSYLP